MRTDGGQTVDARGWFEGEIDAEEAFRLTADLVRIRSYPGEEAAVQRAVADWLAAHGMTSELPEAAPGRPNVVLRLENGPGPTILLNGHTDTVLADPAWDTTRGRAGARETGSSASGRAT